MEARALMKRRFTLPPLCIPVEIHHMRLMTATTHPPVWVSLAKWEGWR